MKTKLVPEKQYTFAEYAKELRRLSKMLKGHTTKETAVEIYIKNEHEFSCGTIHPFILPCKMSAGWKKKIREELKTNKKQIILGKAYMQGDILKGDAQLQVTSEKGNGKILRIARSAKGLLKKVKFGLQLDSGLPQPQQTEEDQTSSKNEPVEVSSSSSEQTTTTPEDKTSDKTTTKTVDPRLEAKKEQGRQAMDRMLKNLKALSDRV